MGVHSSGVGRRGCPGFHLTGSDRGNSRRLKKESSRTECRLQESNQSYYSARVRFRLVAVSLHLLVLTELIELRRGRLRPNSGVEGVRVRGAQSCTGPKGIGPPDSRLSDRCRRLTTGSRRSGARLDLTSGWRARGSTRCTNGTSPSVLRFLRRVVGLRDGARGRLTDAGSEPKVILVLLGRPVGPVSGD